MAKYNDKTARGWPLPNKDNRLYDDVERLREAITLIDETITGVEAHEGAIENRQDSLNIRLDTILEGATEDTEILDARVDSTDTVHPNLGHNIRNLHSQIIALDEDVKYETSERGGLMRQFNEIAYAQVRGEINTQETSERRKKEIQREEETRHAETGTLQAQADGIAEAVLRNTLNIKRETEERRKGLILANDRLDAANSGLNSERAERMEDDASERSVRVEQDNGLQKQSNETAKANLQTALNLHAAMDRHRHDALCEEQKRIQQDRTLQEQTAELSDAILQQNLNAHQESEKRRRELLEVNNRIDSVNEALYLESDARDATDKKLHQEESNRKENDEGLQEQIDYLAKASMQNTSNFEHVHEKYNAGLSHEEILRKEQGRGLQEQADKLAEADIANSISITREANQRRSDTALTNQRVDEAEKSQRKETEAREQEDGIERIVRIGQDDGLQEQINCLAELVTKSVLDAIDTHSRRKRELQSEQAIRGEHDVLLQTQMNCLINTILRQVLNVRQEIKRRREAEEHIAGLLEALKYRILDEAEYRENKDELLKNEIDELANTSLREAINIHAVNKNRKAELINERNEQEMQVKILAEQIYMLALSDMSGTMAIRRDAEHRRRELSRTQRQIDEMTSKEEYLQTQANNLLSAVFSGTLNYNKALTRWRTALHDEVRIHRDNDGIFQLQAYAIAAGSMRNTLTIADTARRIKYGLLEIQHSISEDNALIQSQIDELAYANMQTVLSNYEARSRLKEFTDRLYQAVAETGNLTYKGMRIASKREVGDMIADVLSGSSSGAITETEIPCELKDRIASTAETGEMLDEVFTH